MRMLPRADPTQIVFLSEYYMMVRKCHQKSFLYSMQQLIMSQFMDWS
jgi:hypothetical protein